MAYDKNWKFKDVLSAEKMIYGLKWDKHSFEHSFKQWAGSTAWLQAGLLLRGSCRASADGGCPGQLLAGPHISYNVLDKSSPTFFLHLQQRDNDTFISTLASILKPGP